ncbi:hypothetical protein [Metabacillus iocasae]|uniref:Uncharacterized protein n=1 Tax=Priestia iocasae TaxID=2291674 RepID=A0ABS2QS93_9BACI|nr:hypothetical protein [Metabacillus iocasae]MBM7702173.1 hypothetical protein [Metabacillus iocasae]
MLELWRMYAMKTLGIVSVINIVAGLYLIILYLDKSPIYKVGFGSAHVGITIASMLLIYKIGEVVFRWYEN